LGATFCTVQLGVQVGASAALPCEPRWWCQQARAADAAHICCSFTAGCPAQCSRARPDRRESRDLSSKPLPAAIHGPAASVNLIGSTPPESRALISWRSKEPPPSQCSLPVIRIRLRTTKPRAPVLLVARAPVGGNLSRSNDMRDGGCSRGCKGEPLARKFPRQNVLASRQRCDPG